MNQKQFETYFLSGLNIRMIKSLTRSAITLALALALTQAAAAPPQAGLPDRVLHSPHGVRGPFSFSPDSLMLAHGDYQRLVLVWDVRTGRVVQTIHETDDVAAVAFSPNGGALAVSTYKALKLWEPRTGRLIRDFPTANHGADAIAFSPNGRLLAAGTLDQIMLWDTQTGTVRRTLREKSYRIGAPMTFSPDGRLLADGFPAEGENGIKLWDVESGQIARDLAGSYPVRTLAYSSDGHVIAGWEPRGRVQWGGVMVWDLQTGRASQVPATNPSWPLAFAPDGRILAVTEHQDGGSGDHVRFWDVRADRWTATLSVPPDPRGYQQLDDLSFSPDGHLLAAVVFENVVLWNVGSLLRR